MQKAIFLHEPGNKRRVHIDHVVLVFFRSDTRLLEAEDVKTQELFGAHCFLSHTRPGSQLDRKHARDLRLVDSVRRRESSKYVKEI